MIRSAPLACAFLALTIQAAGEDAACPAGPRICNAPPGPEALAAEDQVDLMQVLSIVRGIPNHGDVLADTIPVRAETSESRRELPPAGAAQTPPGPEAHETWDIPPTTAGGSAALLQEAAKDGADEASALAAFSSKAKEVQASKELLTRLLDEVSHDPPANEVEAMLTTVAFVKSLVQEGRSVGSLVEEKEEERGAQLANDAGKQRQAQWPMDTGGSCWWSGVCDKSRNAKCESSDCVCNDGDYASKGKCIAQEPQCPQDTGGSCRWSGCHAWRNAECEVNKCVCRPGDCVVGGKCIAKTVAKAPQPQCPKDTGGTCKVFGCKSWRKAKCVQGKCVCDSKASECADYEGKCVTRLPAPPANPKKVAVVGCGIAGALTALELAHRGIEVTVVDREANCGVGTSGRIAAEMMFYSYHKSFWKSTWATVELVLAAIANQQAFVSATGLAKAVAWKLENIKMTGSSDKVKVPKYTKGMLTFEKGTISPVVKDAGSLNVKKGWQLEDVSVLPPYELHHANIAEDTDAVLQDLLSKSEGAVEMTFLTSAEPRTNKVYEAAFFEAAGHRLRDFFLHHYPELCEAVITPFCCAPGTPARQWVEANPTEAGYSCPQDPFAPTTGSDGGMGVVHAFVGETIVTNMKEEVAGNAHHHLYDFEIWNQSETKARISNFLQDEHIYGAAVNRQDSGFVRTELLFGIIKKILTKKGASFEFERELAGIETTQGGVKLATRQAGGSWKYTADNEAEFVPSNSVDGSVSTAEFDRVVVSTGAALGDALGTFDPSIARNSELLPAMGYIVLGRDGVLPVEDRDIGVVYEEHHQYLRATRSGAVAIGGGMFFGDSTDDDVRRLRYRAGLGHGSYFDANSYMSQSNIGDSLVKDKQTKKLGGSRPMSVYGQFPLLKSYEGGRVVLNTGAGANGFVCSWKSAELAADLAVGGTTTDEFWNAAFSRVFVASP